MNSCKECTYNKQNSGLREGEYHFDDIDTLPFRVTHIDHVGPFSRSSKGYEQVLVIADSFPKIIII